MLKDRNIICPKLAPSPRESLDVISEEDARGKEIPYPHMSGGDPYAKAIRANGNDRRNDGKSNADESARLKVASGIWSPRPIVG